MPTAATHHLHDPNSPNTTARCHPPETFYNVSSVSRSAIMLRNIEIYVRNHEEKFGRPRLLRTIENVSPDDLSTHVDRYRALVRSNEWPNVMETTSLAEFLDAFERSCLAYVHVAFSAMEYVAGGTDATLAAMYRQVLASEALRGQYGKRSPSGLDARLDWYETQLEQTLADVCGDGTESALHLLCTPNDPHLTAESALLEDFASVRAVFSEPPTTNDILASNPSDREIVFRFLRRHARWSIHHLSECYRQLGMTDLLEDRLNVARESRRDLAACRTDLIAYIAERCPVTIAARIFDLAATLTVLNHVNLAVEPSFSFKGGVGLAHSLIFNLVEKTTPGVAVTWSEITRDKWALFANTTPSL